MDMPFRRSNIKHESDSGFTIVELLVVIVVIGILATITIVSYTGISRKAISASLQNDLDNVSKQLKLFQVDNSNYPATISTNCSTNPTNTTNLCLKLSTGNSYIGYSASNQSNPQTFYLVVGNNSINYKITDNTAPTLLAQTQPNVTPGAVLELHAAKTNGGISPGINDPLTTTWTDTSGNGNSGTLTNFTGTPWGGMGTSANPYQLALDGADDTVVIPSAIAPRLGDFTVEAWVKMPSGVASNYGTVLAYGSWNVPNHYGLWNSHNNDQLRLSLNRADYASNLGLMVTVGYDAWHHVVGTFDRDGNLIAYLDGTPTGAPVSISGLNDVDYSSGPEIGYYSGWYMQQSVALARLYPFTLSAAQIAANYAAGSDW